MNVKYEMKLKLNKLKWWWRLQKRNIAYKLVQAEAVETRDIISDVFECETDLSLGPNPIELKVVTGHNQKVVIKNGKRVVHLMLMDQQIIVECWGQIDIKGETKVVSPKSSVHSWAIPYNPEELRKLYSLNNKKP